MQKEMLNINGNLIGEVQVETIQGKDGEIAVSNFTLFRKMGKTGEKKKEYINCMEKKQSLQKTLKKEILFMSTDITKRFKKKIRAIRTL